MGFLCDDYLVIDVECSDFVGNVWGDGLVEFGCGQVVGTTVVKKVQIYEINDSNAKETGVTSVHASQKTDNAIYNLAGQKVSSSYKGIVIRNGKKVVIK